MEFHMPSAFLADRGVIKVTGEDARSFLNGLVTSDMDKVAVDRARYAALLTPQGKVLFDFIVAEADGEQGGGFYLDAPLAPRRTSPSVSASTSCGRR